MSSQTQEVKTDAKTDAKETQTSSQETQQELEELSQEFPKESIELCKFCNVKLNYGFDENEMIHCQNCHNIWDGNAQCNC